MKKGALLPPYFDLNKNFLTSHIMIPQRSPVAFKLRILPWNAYVANASPSFYPAVAKDACDCKMNHLLPRRSSTLVNHISKFISRPAVLARKIRPTVSHATETECQPNLGDASSNCARSRSKRALISVRLNYKASIGSSLICPTSADDIHIDSYSI